MLDVDTTTLGDFSTAPEPDDACVNYESCGNVVPHRGMICPDCLDKARDNGSGA